MKTARLHRLFHPKTGRCFDAALACIENMTKTNGTLVDAGPDGIPLTVGQAWHSQALPQRGGGTS